MAGIKKGEIREFFPLKPRTIFCFVIGGITYAELGAINFIEKITGSKIVIASDCVASGADFIEAAFCWKQNFFWCFEKNLVLLVTLKWQISCVRKKENTILQFRPLALQRIQFPLFFMIW